MAVKQETIDHDVIVQGRITATEGLSSAELDEVITKVATTESRLQQATADSARNVSDTEASIKSINGKITSLEDHAVVTGVVLSSSATSLKRSRTGALSPATVAFTAALSDGTPYLGRFQIYELLGGNWVLRYTSLTLESSHTHTPSVSASSVRAEFSRVD
jgi:hypothetical protein